MIDPHDDLGTAKAPFKVIACIPVYGRLPLVKLTIERLLWKNGVDKVICSGHKKEDMETCLNAGAIWVQHDNAPLGAKWNSCFLKAKQFNPDACLYVGSSDWLSDNWLYLMRPYLTRYGMIGVPGMHLLDIGETNRVCKWPGYVGRREGESIGIGRLLTKDLLDRLNWLPFNSKWDSSLDGSMKDNVKIMGYADYMVRDDRLIALSLSTPYWDNMHRFQDHWDNRLPSERILEVDKFLNHFPEAYTLCESLKAVSQKV